MGLASRSRTVRLPPGARDALKRHRTRQAEEKLKADSAYQDGGRISRSTNSKIGRLMWETELPALEALSAAR